MGASSSVSPFYHIHISVSTKFQDEHHIIHQIASKLRTHGIEVSITDSSKTTKEVCDTLKQSNMVIYCITQNYATCPMHALEYSYFAENEKPVYNLIVDRETNGDFTQRMQSLLEEQTWNVSSVQEIPSIIQNINHKMLTC